jgi:hypothetical protein
MPWSMTLRLAHFRLLTLPFGRQGLEHLCLPHMDFRQLTTSVDWTHHDLSNSFASQNGSRGSRDALKKLS